MEGQPHDRVIVVTTRAWNAAVKMHCMDIQQADMNSLWAMASQLLGEHVFLLESFELMR